MKYDTVLVEWHDAHAVAPSWINIDDIDNEPATVQTVGFVLPNIKPNHIVLAQSLLGDECDHTIAIPDAMVKSIHVLTVATKSI